MKPKLLLGRIQSGKTYRLLETVMWLKAVVIVSTETYARDLNRQFHGKKAYANVTFISCSNLHKLAGRDFDIICVDEWRMCGKDFWNYLDRSKIQPVFTERLDTEHFDVEVM